jgi:hypothetical protein
LHRSACRGRPASGAWPRARGRELGPLGWPLAGGLWPSRASHPAPRRLGDAPGWPAQWPQEGTPRAAPPMRACQRVRARGAWQAGAPSAGPQGVSSIPGVHGCWSRAGIRGEASARCGSACMLCGPGDAIHAGSASVPAGVVQSGVWPGCQAQAWGVPWGRRWCAAGGVRAGGGEVRQTRQGRGLAPGGAGPVARGSRWGGVSQGGAWGHRWGWPTVGGRLPTAPNKRLQPTPYSARCAPASGRG